MFSPLKTNLIPQLENLVAAIQPFAIANFVNLKFESSFRDIEISHHPEALIPDLSKLIYRIITFTPQEHDVTLQVVPVDVFQGGFFQICIINSGSNLECVKNTILSEIKWNVSIFPIEKGGTKFKLEIPMDEQDEIGAYAQLISPDENKKYIVAPFFKKLKKHLHSHFSSIQNLEKAASGRSQRDGVFLKKVNAIIIANLDREGFDSTSLSKAVALSRSQLYRRLKPLTRFSPAHYIRYVRLQKAKEFIENQDLPIGEVAFSTGFMNQSHFTRTFREQFGFNPSDLRRKEKEKHNLCYLHE